MPDYETTVKWEKAKWDILNAKRGILKLVDEIDPIPGRVNDLQAPDWWSEGFKKDPSGPEPKVNLILSAILWELAFEAISKNELSETSTILLAIKESGILPKILDEQAAQMERAAENFRMRSASLASKSV